MIPRGARDVGTYARERSGGAPVLQRNPAIQKASRVSPIGNRWPHRTVVAGARCHEG